MTRDELFEKLDDMVSLSDYETQLVLDALDALGQGPQRVAELEAALLKADAQREVLEEHLCTLTRLRRRPWC